MAVISVDEIDGREVSREENMNRSINRKYRIRCDIPNEEEAIVLIGSGMPAILAPHPTVPVLRCTSVRVTQQTDNDPYVWIASVSWKAIVLNRTPSATNSDPSKRNENPLLRPAIFSFTTEKFQRPMQRDRPRTDFPTGKPILNSAHDFFEQPLMKDDFRPTITIVKNVATWSIPTWRKAINKLNLTDFLGFGPGELKIADMTASEQFENDQPYYAKTTVIHCASEEDGDWVSHVLDCGYQKLVAGKKKEIFLDGGTKPSSPVRLDGSGAVLAEASDSVFLDFELYGYTEYADLSII